MEWLEGATWDSLGFGLEKGIGFHQHNLKHILSGCQSGLKEHKILKTFVFFELFVDFEDLDYFEVYVLIESTDFIEIIKLEWSKIESCWNEYSIS